MSKTTKVAIVGAGITGLSLAWHLKRRYGELIDLHVIEKNASCGGWIQTDKEAGFLFERGPNSCRSAGSAPLLRLIEELGLQDAMLFASPNAKNRYLYLDQKLISIPKNPWQWMSSSWTRALLPRMLLEWKVAPSNQEESVFDWAERRFGKGVAEKFLDPLMRGIFAGDSKKLSMRACMPSLVDLEHQHGSLTKALLKSLFKKKKREKEGSIWMQESLKKGIFTLRFGWQYLIEALKCSLLQTSGLRMGSEVIQMALDEGAKPKVKLTLSTGEDFHADAVYMTTPAHQTAKILENAIPAAAETLNEIPFQSVTLVQVGFNSSVLNYKGFGHLVPSLEDPETLGVIWNSSVFPEHDIEKQTRLTIMLSGIVEVSEDKVCALLQRHLGIVKRPDLIAVHPLYKAIAQYTLGHQTRVQKARDEVKKKMPQIVLLGNSYDGVSLSASVAQAEKAALDYPLPGKEV